MNTTIFEFTGLPISEPCYISSIRKLIIFCILCEKKCCILCGKYCLISLIHYFHMCSRHNLRDVVPNTVGGLSVARAGVTTLLKMACLHDPRLVERGVSPSPCWRVGAALCRRLDWLPGEPPHSDNKNLQHKVVKTVLLKIL